MIEWVSRVTERLPRNGAEIPITRSRDGIEKFVAKSGFKDRRIVAVGSAWEGRSSCSGHT